MATNYVSLGWAAGVPLSAANMIHMEGIATACKSHTDEHGHPAVHYLKAEADAKFFPQASGLDADKVDGYDSDDLIGNQAPLGLVLLHKGADAEFSNGYLIADPRWHICDGGTYNGIKTRDMRGYFPKCPNTSSGTGTGGAATVVLSGTVAYGNHLLTVAEIPSHYHDWSDIYFSAMLNRTHNSPDCLVFYDTKSQASRTSAYNHDASDEAHNHGMGNINLNSINLTPLWKGYYFICKVL